MRGRAKGRRSLRCDGWATHRVARTLTVSRPYDLCVMRIPRLARPLLAVALGCHEVRADPARLAQVLDLEPVLRPGDGDAAAEIEADEPPGRAFTEIEHVIRAVTMQSSSGTASSRLSAIR